MLSAADEATVYCVDANNRLAYISPSWLEFASDNHAPNLVESAVLGQPLLEFFAGDDLCCLFELIMERVRSTHRPLSFPFRCDSPTQRRFMSLTIRPLPESGLEFTAEILRGERRNYVALLDPVVLHSDEWLTICSWCKRVEVREEWLEAEDAVIHLHLFSAPALPRLTHGMCDDCAVRVRREYEHPGSVESSDPV